MPHRLPDTPPDAIPDDRLADGTRDREADSRPVRIGLADGERSEEWPRVPGALVVYSSKILGAQQTDTFRKTCDGSYLSELTVSLCRPRARRRDKTARPFFVSIRERKPWVFAR